MSNPEENLAQRPASSPKTLGQILEQSTLLQNSKSMPNQPAQNLSTIGNPQENQCLTGKQPSEIVLGKLQSIAQSVQQGRLMDDQELKASLEQHFGSRLAIRESVKRVYGDHGYDEIFDGFIIELDQLANEEMRIYDALQFFNRCASIEVLAGEMAKLRVSMPRRAEENTDIELLIDVMVEDCCKYPADVVKSVSQRWRLENRFFPTPKAFRAKLEEAVAFRRAIWNCLQEKRNPMLPSAQKKRLEDENKKDWKQIPRSQWDPSMWAAWIADAEGMLKLAQENPVFLNPDEWQKEVENRRSQVPLSA